MHIFSKNLSLEKDKGGKKSGGFHIVAGYEKEPGGFDEDKMRDPQVAQRERAKKVKDPNYKTKIMTHVRSNPKPTKNEEEQKKLNNKLAAEGKKYRYTITPNGTKKKVSLTQRVKDQKKKRGHEGAPGAAYKEVTKKDYSNRKNEAKHKKLKSDTKSDIKRINNADSTKTKRYVEANIRKRENKKLKDIPEKKIFTNTDK